MQPDRDISVSVVDLDESGAEIVLTLSRDGRDLLEAVAAGRRVDLQGAAYFVLRRGLAVLHQRVRRHRAMQNRAHIGTVSTPQNAAPSSKPAGGS